MDVDYVKDKDRGMIVKARSGRADYARGIRSAVRGLWAGQLDLGGFMDAMYSSVQIGLRNAFYAGLREYGINPEEATISERNALQDLIARESNFVINFSEAILAGSKDNGGKLGPLMKRGELWLGRYSEAQNLGRQLAAGNQKLLWVRNAADSCSSCLTLEGRIYRASVWRKYGLRPQAYILECVTRAKGVPVCKCEFAATTDRVTPGYPPMI